MSALDDLLTRRRSRVWTAVALTISLMIGGVLVWAGFARFDEVAVATGEVVPRSNVKTIQHLEGGIIETLNVREGDRVRSGDMLLTLRLGANRLNRQEIQVRIASFELRRARLLAEASGAKFTPDPAADPGLAAVAEAESRALDARRRELESSLAVTRSQIEQMRQSLRELEARAASVEQELVLARRQFAMSSNLLKDGKRHGCPPACQKPPRRARKPNAVLPKRGRSLAGGRLRKSLWSKPKSAACASCWRRPARRPPGPVSAARSTGW